MMLHKKITATLFAVLLLTAWCVLPPAPAFAAEPLGKLYLNELDRVSTSGKSYDQLNDFEASVERERIALFNGDGVTVKADGSFSITCEAPAYRWDSKDGGYLSAGPMTLKMWGKFDLEKLASISDDTEAGRYYSSYRYDVGEAVAITTETVDNFTYLTSGDTDGKYKISKYTETIESQIKITWNSLGDGEFEFHSGQIDENAIGYTGFMHKRTRSGYIIDYGGETYNYTGEAEEAHISYHWVDPEYVPDFPVGNTAPQGVVINTKAGSTPGETRVSVPAAIVVGTAGTVAALAAAAAANGGGAAAAGLNVGNNAEAKRRRRRQYYLYVHKEFGDFIRYNSPQVTVYARMTEVDEKGVEHARPDLTQAIRISSGGLPIKVDGETMAGDYKGALVCAEAPLTAAGRPSAGIVSFYYAGEGGTFRENMEFRLLGEPTVRLAGKYADKVLLPARMGVAPRRERIELVDFAEPPTSLELASVPGKLVDVSLEKGTDGQWYLLVASLEDNTSRPKDRFYKDVTVEIVARNGQAGEEIRGDVTIYVFFDGIISEYLGDGRREIKAYRDHSLSSGARSSFAGVDISDTSVYGTIEVTPGPMMYSVVEFRMGLWDDGADEFTYPRPPEPYTLECTGDEATVRILDKLKFKYTADENQPTDGIRLRLETELPYPATKPLKAELAFRCTGKDDVPLEFSDEIDIAPDSLQLEKDLRKEFLLCVIAINDSGMPEGLRAKKSDEMVRLWGKASVEDLHIYREELWKYRLHNFDREMGAHQGEDAWYADAINDLEIIKFIGSIAFNAYIGAKVSAAYQAYLAMVLKDVIVNYLGYKTTTWNSKNNEAAFDTFVTDCAKDMWGNLGEFANFKGDWKKLIPMVAWFIFVRFVYHYEMQPLDNEGEPKGISGAMKYAMIDLGAQLSGEMLGRYLNAKATREIAEKSATVKGNKAGFEADVVSGGAQGFEGTRQVIQEVRKAFDEFRTKLLG